jgi:hypothetical protein
MKWLSGMCDKCFSCVKKDHDLVDPYTVAKVVLDR